MTKQANIIGGMTKRTIIIGGREYRRFIHFPETNVDGAPRCIACGQIDEQPWHNAEICRAMPTIYDRARAHAESEIGGWPLKCWGHKADRYNAAFVAARDALISTMFAPIGVAVPE